MHPESMKEMKEFSIKYNAMNNDNLKVLDVGSFDVNGSYRDLFGIGYTGLDIIDGPKVDIVTSSVYPKVTRKCSLASFSDTGYFNGAVFNTVFML